MTDTALDPQRAALMVIDVQERLWPAMDPSGRAEVERNILILIEAARQLELPVLWSEQYPKGLGATVPAIQKALSAPGLEAHRLEKVEFSCAAAPAFAQLSRTIGRSQWILCGIEAHVCVYQTARDLAADAGVVHVVADAVMSRKADNRTVGLGLMQHAGATITSTETVVFDLLHRAGTEDFKALSRLLR
jgi:nicotinamidase-related amidase